MTCVCFRSHFGSSTVLKRVVLPLPWAQPPGKTMATLSRWPPAQRWLSDLADLVRQDTTKTRSRPRDVEGNHNTNLEKER